MKASFYLGGQHLCLIIGDAIVPFPLLQSLPITFTKRYMLFVRKVFNNLITQLQFNGKQYPNWYYYNYVLGIIDLNHITSSKSFNSAIFSTFGLLVPCRTNIHMCSALASSNE